jgi:phage-related protein
VARKWALTFENRLYPEAAEILAFLRTNNLAFDWTDPDGAPGRWKCASWRQTHPKPLVKTITAEFEEVFGRD